MLSTIQYEYYDLNILTLWRLMPNQIFDNIIRNRIFQFFKVNSERDNFIKKDIPSQCGCLQDVFWGPQNHLQPAHQTLWVAPSALHFLSPVPPIGTVVGNERAKVENDRKREKNIELFFFFKQSRSVWQWISKKWLGRDISNLWRVFLRDKQKTVYH